MLYNELEQGNILSEIRLRLATRAYTDISLRSIGPVHKIRQSPVIYFSKRDNVKSCFFPIWLMSDSRVLHTLYRT
jgi:hypothetical protein